MTRKASLCGAISLAAVLAAASPLLAGKTERISLAAAGWQGVADSWAKRASAMTPDARYVVFTSAAWNLVDGDRNDSPDGFLRDRLMGTTIRVTVASDGTEADWGGGDCAISEDGQYVGFGSISTNLAPGETTIEPRFFFRDCATGLTQMVVLGIVGETATTSDARSVAFVSDSPHHVPADTNNCTDVFVYDQATQTTERVSISSLGEEANGESWEPAISADGRFVAFYSWASNLVEDDTNGIWDVFVRDRLLGVTERVSVTDGGAQANEASVTPSVSGDGRFVAFESGASNLVPGDVNDCVDVFVRDRAAGTTELVSVGNAGQQGDDDCWQSAISGDGRFVVFISLASNLAADAPGGYDQVYLRDRLLGRTQCVSRSSEGEPGDSTSWRASLSPDGRYVLFTSGAANLVPGDTNGQSDVFLRDRLSFADVPLDYWAFYEVEGCVNGRVVMGYPDGLYHPDEQVKRDQMAVYIARALAGGEENVPDGPATPTFPDVPASSWCYRHVEYCFANGVVQGYWDGYHPMEVVSRAQMAVYVSRALVAPSGDDGLPDPPPTPTFPDVPASYWAYRWIEYCYAQGVVQGYPDGYRPEETVNRAQMAVYVQRAFQLPM
jgi:Tol biopolymer transport system component